MVHNTTYQNVKYKAYHSQDQMDEFFRQFFGQSYGQQEDKSSVEQEQKAGSGSGVIVTSEGYIVTNNHVVKGADRIEVVLNDKRRYQAELIGLDASTDLAVLKIDEVDLPYMKYGNSDDVKIGEWVLAVGNPFDLTSTVTAGIVSAKARNINILKDKHGLAIESFIQTDAAVNPGNSGGALVNLKGELIGINTAIATPTGTFAGYSFAVPSQLVHKVVDDLIKYGVVQRALLGIAITDVTADVAEEHGLTDIKGVYVSGVGENSAANDAGIQEGDVILKVNKQEVNSSSELQEAVAVYRPGDEVELTFLRDGNVERVSVVLKNKLGNTEIVNSNELQSATVFNAKLRELTTEEMEEYGVQNGLMVEDTGDGLLKKSGLMNGFVTVSYTHLTLPTTSRV